MAMDEQWVRWQQYQQTYTAEQSQGSEGSRTLWVGEVETWMDEGYLQQMFLSVGYCVQAKVIRDKVTGLPSGYGFVEFTSHELANSVL